MAPSRGTIRLGNPFPIVSRVSSSRVPCRGCESVTYRLRARTVDLAVPFSERDLDPPDLISHRGAGLLAVRVAVARGVTAAPDTEGESLEHLVIRSNLGITAANYVELPTSSERSSMPRRRTRTRRIPSDLAPPVIRLMAEQDSRFDAAFGGTPAEPPRRCVALGEEGTFSIRRSSTRPRVRRRSRNPPSSCFTVDADAARRGAGLPGGVRVLSRPECDLPYLPIRWPSVYRHGTINKTEVFHQVAMFPAGALAHAVPSAAPEGAVGVRRQRARVRLPKAEVVWARLASVFPDNRLTTALWQWVPGAKKTPALKWPRFRAATMLTPFREVIFTHAVQQPLAVPDMTKVTSSRSAGDTFAEFRGPIANHAKSTGRLDVFGRWTEDVDLDTDDAPRMRESNTEVPHRAHAFGFEVRRSDQARSLQQARHEFGDTNTAAQYRSVATTRFREFLPRPLTDVQANIERAEADTDANNQDRAALVPYSSSARPLSPGVLHAATFRWERQDDGDGRTSGMEALFAWLRRPRFSSGDGRAGRHPRASIDCTRLGPHRREALCSCPSGKPSRRRRVDARSGCCP
jgi:hypothetical protein